MSDCQIYTKIYELEVATINDRTEVELKTRPIYECRCDERLKPKGEESTCLAYKIKPICECRCDERLRTKTKRFTRLSYTGLVVELEHLKIKTRLTNEKFASVMGECVI